MASNAPDVLDGENQILMNRASISTLSSDGKMVLATDTEDAAHYSPLFVLDKRVCASRVAGPSRWNV